VKSTINHFENISLFGDINSNIITERNSVLLIIEKQKTLNYPFLYPITIIKRNKIAN